LRNPFAGSPVFSRLKYSFINKLFAFIDMFD